jgi:hypothetical protein
MYTTELPPIFAFAFAVILSGVATWSTCTGRVWIQRAHSPLKGFRQVRRSEEPKLFLFAIAVHWLAAAGLFVAACVRWWQQM